MTKALYLLTLLISLSLMSCAAWLATLYGPSGTADLVGMFGGGLFAFLSISTISESAAVPHVTHDADELELEAEMTELARLEDKNP